MPEVFWKKHPQILIDPRYIHRFFPSPVLTTEEKMNSIVRLGAYIGIGLAIVQKSITWIFLPIIAAVITMAWYSEKKIWVDDEDEPIHHSPKYIKHHDRSIEYLAKQILSGKTRDIENRHRSSKKKKISSRSNDKIFNDLDTNLESVRNERAILTKKMDTGMPDSPRFARKMMKKDIKRLRGNKYSPW